jgi:hypothetical protein
MNFKDLMNLRKLGVFDTMIINGNMAFKKPCVYFRYHIACYTYYFNNTIHILNSKMVIK